MPTGTDTFTYRDVLDHLVDYRDSNPSANAMRDARRAMKAGLREISNVHRWSYLYGVGRINTVASYSTGTFAYDHTGDTYERQVTLTDGTWPDWAAYSVFEYNDVTYEVAERYSDTVVQLSANSNPGADIAAGATYKIYRDTYTLPVDFQAMDEPYSQALNGPLEYVTPHNWLAAQRSLPTSGPSTVYTITGSPDFQNAMAIRFYPWPDTATTIDYVYHKYPRNATVEDEHAGTVTTVAGSTTITGSNTNFTDDVIGSIIRISGDTSLLPTGRDGANPFAYERMIMGRNSATSITVDQNLSEALTNTKYVISDPIDIESGPMANVFLRLCEAQLAKIVRLPDREDIQADFELALRRAKESDMRVFSRMSIHGEPYWSAHRPLGTDVE